MCRCKFETAAFHLFRLRNIEIVRSKSKPAQDQRIDLRSKESDVKVVSRVSKHLFVFAFVLVFASALSCASLAAPGHSFSSVAGCPRDGGMQMTECQQFLCGFGSSTNLLSRGALSSARYNDLTKSAHDLSIGEVPADASKEADLIGKNSDDAFLVQGFHKVSTRLLNSVLNL